MERERARVIRQADAADADRAAPLVAGFRVELRRLKGRETAPDVERGREEFLEYCRAGYPIYLAEVGGACAGYLVCRVDEPVVWVESIYVAPDFRRQGIASVLFDQAQAYAAGFGEDTLYNCVHPNNHGMIQFLAKKGYQVLNLVEIRRAYPGETPASKVQVGDHLFDY